MILWYKPTYIEVIDMNKAVKISQITMIVFIVLYILETVLLSGLFTNLLIGALALASIVVAGIIAIIKKKYPIALIDLILMMSVMAFLWSAYLM